MRQAAACPVCDSSNRDFLCPNCINGQCLVLSSAHTAGAEQHLQQCLALAESLRQQKAELLQRLETQLAAQADARARQFAAWQKQQELKAAQARAQKAKDALTQARQQLNSLKAASQQRRQVLEQLVQRTAATRAAVCGSELPNVLRIQALTFSHVKAMLEREQRLRLRQLTEIFPLRINAVRKGGGPVQITICNLKLPQTDKAPEGGWPEPEATSAALGYLLLLIDHVGLIMGGPILHESHYQGSTSSIWRPPGFWTRQPRSPAAMLPLNVLPTASGAGTAASQATYTSSTSRYLQSATFWGLPRADSGGLAAGTAAAAASAAATAATAAAAAFTRATGLEPPGYLYGSSPSSASAAGAGAGGSAGLPRSSSSGSGGSSTAPEPGGGRVGKGPDFRAAWELLQYSLTCFLKDKAARNGMQLPEAWNPVAWLVVYCAVVKRDVRQDGKLVALSSSRTHLQPAVAGSRLQAGEGAGAAEYAPVGVTESSLGSMVVGADAGGLDAAGAEAPGVGWEDAEEEEEDEGWVVQTPFLPPPPSQPDQVEHWVRAMFADPNALAGSSSGSGSSLRPGVGGALIRTATGVNLGSSPSNAVGMMSMERIRSLFSM